MSGGDRPGWTSIADLDLRLERALGRQALRRNAQGDPVLSPSGREPLRLALRILAEARQPWRPCGGARRPAAGDGLRVRAPAGILDLWKGDLVARVGAGLTFTELEDRLRETGLSLGTTVPLPARATLGGSFAAGEVGLPGGIGRCLRDLVLSCTWMDAAGRVYKGGARVVKNVAGYDTVRLHHGAGGSFGIISDLTVRLRARPAEQLWRWRPVPLNGLAETWRQGIRSPSAATVFIDRGAAGRLGLGTADGILDMEEGPGRTRPRGQSDNGAELSPEIEARMRDFGWETSEDGHLLRWLAAPSALIELWPSLRRELQDRGLEPALMSDLLSGHGRLVLRGRLTGSARELLREAAEESRRRGGSLWLDRGARLLRNSTRSATDLSALRRLREAFDPHGLLPRAPEPLRGRA